LVASGAVQAAQARAKCFGLAATIVGDKGANIVKGTPGDDVIAAKGGNDRIIGGDGDDVICGGKGEDLVDAGDGDDILLGQGSDDVLQAGPGDDILLGQGGNDTMDGREGDLDQVDYSAATAPIQADLSSHSVTGQGTDSVFAVEVVFGSPFDDTLTAGTGGGSLFGSGGNDMLNGGGFDDTLEGGPGDDTISGANGFDALTFFGSSTPVTVDLAAGTAAGEGTDTFTSVELVYGSELNDTIRGNDQSNVLSGMGGDDIVDGRGDVDVIAFPFTEAGVVVDMGPGTATGQGADTFSAIEGVYGSPFDDALTGNDAANILYGDLGNDTLKGLGGDDYFVPDLGDDVVDGGAGGYDIVDFGFSLIGVTASLTTGSATGDGQDSMTGIEALVGSDFHDELEGGPGDDILFGGIGPDLLKGLAGNDDLSGGPDSDFTDGGPGFDNCSTNEGGASCEAAAAPPPQALLGRGRTLGGAARRSHRRSH
jgi:Ca2+-binding RTX toxin-like protein